MSNAEKTRPTRREKLLGERPGNYAIARGVRMSPTKVRRVTELIDGLDVNDAQDLLHFTPQAAGEPVSKTLASAVANAQQSNSLRPGELYVANAFVDEAMTMRRIRPRARGSASRIMKRGSHITIVVCRKEA